MKVIIHGIAILLIIFVSGWLLYYAKHNHDPMGNRIDAEKTYMLVGCGIGAVIGILCGIYMISSVTLGIGLGMLIGMLIGMMVGITVPKIKKKEKTWQQK